jgi:hypothetical protein
MTRYGTFFNAKCAQKWTAITLFLTLLDRFKNHKFYERKRMKKLALFLTDVKKIFLFDTVRIWEFSPVWTDVDKFDNLSKRNVKLILTVLSDLEPLRGSSNKKTLYSTRSCVNWAFFGTRGPLKRSFHSRFKMVHSC